MAIRYVGSNVVHEQLYDEREYKDIVKRGLVQILRPVEGESPFVDSSSVRVYLGIGNDYEFGLVLSRLCNFKRESPTALYDVIASQNVYPPYSDALLDQLQSLSPSTERLNYDSDIGLSTALQYVATSWDWFVGARFKPKPSDDVIRKARILIDRVDKFTTILDNRSNILVDTDTGIHFGDKWLSYQDDHWGDIACNDMAFKSFTRGRGAADALSDDGLVSWNKLHQNVITSPDYVECEDVKYTILYNPAVDMIFVWKTEHTKIADRLLK